MHNTTTTYLTMSCWLRMVIDNCLKAC